MMMKVIYSWFKAYPLALVLLVTFVIYSPSLKNDILNWDDDTHLTNNHLVRSLSLNYFKEIFTSTTLDVYIPLTILTYAVEYHFFAYNPFVYHLNNVLLHLCVVALVYWFVLLLGQKAATAFFAALIFGIHPIHVESVSWITERKDVLYSVFYMLSLCFYIRYLKTERKMFYYSLSLLCGLLSILSKPMALSLPLVLFVCDWFCQRKICRKVLFDKVLYFLYVVPVSWVTYALHQRIPEFDFGKSVLIWLWSFSFYIEKFFWPTDLRPLYKLPEPVGVFEAEYWIAAIIFFLCLYLCRKYRSNPLFIFSFIFYFVSIFFLLRFDSKVDINIVADRFMYLPCLGFCIFLGWGAAQLVEKFNLSNRWIMFSIIGVGVLLLMIQTSSMVKVWKSSLSLWSYVIKKNQTSALAYNNRGETYSRLGMFDEALKDYNRALELDPKHASSYTNRADAYLAKGKKDEAFSDLNKALAYELSPATLHNRGNLYFKTGKVSLALEDYNQALSINPFLKEAFNNRGLLYVYSNQLGLARKDFDRAIAIDPLYVDSLVNRCFVNLSERVDDQAIVDCSKALKINPNAIMAYYNRGIAYRHKDNLELSLKDFQVVISVQPTNAQAYLNRSFTYSNQKRWKEALADALKAKEFGVGQLDQYINDLIRYSQKLEIIKK